MSKSKTPAKKSAPSKSGSQSKSKSKGSSSKNAGKSAKPAKTPIDKKLQRGHLYNDTPIADAINENNEVPNDQGNASSTAPHTYGGNQASRPENDDEFSNAPKGKASKATADAEGENPNGTSGEQDEE